MFRPTNWRAHRLYSAQACREWMQQRGMTQAQLEGQVEIHAAVAGLRRRLTANCVDDFYAAHQEWFDVACIAQVVLDDMASAAATHARILSGEATLYDAAKTGCLRKARQDGVAASTVFRSLTRGPLDSALTRAVFAARPGDLLEPIACEAGCVVAEVLSIERPELDDALRGRIEQLLFDQWLDGRREAAQIEWYWRDER
jgi:hypothetical protein